MSIQLISSSSSSSSSACDDAIGSPYYYTCLRRVLILLNFHSVRRWWRKILNCERLKHFIFRIQQESSILCVPVWACLGFIAFVADGCPLWELRYWVSQRYCFFLLFCWRSNHEHLIWYLSIINRNLWLAEWIPLTKFVEIDPSESVWPLPAHCQIVMTCNHTIYKNAFRF